MIKTFRWKEKSLKAANSINILLLVSSYFFQLHIITLGMKYYASICNGQATFLFRIILCRWYRPRCLTHSTMDITLFVLMTIACICLGYRGRASLPPPLQGNLANSVDGYAFLYKPRLLANNRAYENRDTGKLQVLQRCHCFFSIMERHEIKYSL